MRLLRRIISPIIHRFGRFYDRLVLYSEYKSQFELEPRNIKERPQEYAFVMNAVRDFTPQTVLDVGTGMAALPADLRTCGCTVTASDNIVDFWQHGMVNRHWYIVNDDIRKTAITKRFNMVTCISVLEHIDGFDDAIAGMASLLETPGYIVLTFPYNEHQFIDNVYALEGAGYGREAAYKCHVFSREQIDAWCERHSLEVVRQEYWHVFTGDYWTFGERVYPNTQVGVDEKHHLTCLLLKKG